MVVVVVVTWVEGGGGGTEQKIVARWQTVIVVVLELIHSRQVLLCGLFVFVVGCVFVFILFFALILQKMEAAEDQWQNFGVYFTHETNLPSALSSPSSSTFQLSEWCHWFRQSKQSVALNQQVAKGANGLIVD